MERGAGSGVIVKIRDPQHGEPQFVAKFRRDQKSCGPEGRKLGYCKPYADCVLSKLVQNRLKLGSLRVPPITRNFGVDDIFSFGIPEYIDNIQGVSWFNGTKVVGGADDPDRIRNVEAEEALKRRYPVDLYGPGGVPGLQSAVGAQVVNRQNPFKVVKDAWGWMSEDLGHGRKIRFTERFPKTFLGDSFSWLEPRGCAVARGEWPFSSAWRTAQSVPEFQRLAHLGAVGRARFHQRWNMRGRHGKSIGNSRFPPDRSFLDEKGREGLKKNREMLHGLLGKELASEATAIIEKMESDREESEVRREQKARLRGFSRQTVNPRQMALFEKRSAEFDAGIDPISPDETEPGEPADSGEDAVSRHRRRYRHSASANLTGFLHDPPLISTPAWVNNPFRWSKSQNKEFEIDEFTRDRADFDNFPDGQIYSVKFSEYASGFKSLTNFVEHVLLNDTLKAGTVGEARSAPPKKNFADMFSHLSLFLRVSRQVLNLAQLLLRHQAGHCDLNADHILFGFMENSPNTGDGSILGSTEMVKESCFSDEDRGLSGGENGLGTVRAMCKPPTEEEWPLSDTDNGAASSPAELGSAISSAVQNDNANATASERRFPPLLNRFSLAAADEYPVKVAFIDDDFLLLCTQETPQPYNDAMRISEVLLYVFRGLMVYLDRNVQQQRWAAKAAAKTAAEGAAGAAEDRNENFLLDGRPVVLLSELVDDPVAILKKTKDIWARLSTKHKDVVSGDDARNLQAEIDGVEKELDTDHSTILGGEGSTKTGGNTRKTGGKEEDLSLLTDDPHGVVDPNAIFTEENNGADFLAWLRKLMLTSPLTRNGFWRHPADPVIVSRSGYSPDFFDSWYPLQPERWLPYAEIWTNIAHMTEICAYYYYLIGRDPEPEGLVYPFKSRLRADPETGFVPVPPERVNWEEMNTYGPFFCKAKHPTKTFFDRYPELEDQRLRWAGNETTSRLVSNDGVRLKSGEEWLDKRVDRFLERAKGKSSNANSSVENCDKVFPMGFSSTIHLFCLPSAGSLQKPVHRATELELIYRVLADIYGVLAEFGNQLFALQARHMSNIKVIRADEVQLKELFRNTTRTVERSRVQFERILLRVTDLRRVLYGVKTEKCCVREV